MEHAAHTGWRPSHVIAMLALGVPTAVQVLSGIATVPLWAIWLILLGAVIAALGRRRRRIGPLAGKELTITVLLVFALCALILLVAGIVRWAEAKTQHEAAALRLLMSHDARAGSAALKSAAPKVVTSLADNGMAAAISELRRREYVKEHQHAADEAAKARVEQLASLKQAEQNKAAIAAEQVRIDALPKEAVDDRLAGYRRLAALDPANRTYRAEAAKLVAHIEEYQRRIDNPESNIDVVRSTWFKAGFGNVYMLDVTLKNTSPWSWKDFRIVCQNYAPSGTMVAANRGAILDVLAPGQKRRFRKVNLGFVDPQAASSSCTVEGAMPA
ncbi:MAG: hypothetical protein EON59_11660 [Alphaproteobacteria bacterium]|nr:MAG: hypothetical protein EON59_11660 [Alphaproteobacteria bacterium]